MTEDKHRKWDVLAKFIAPAITVIGILVGVIQFGREQANIRERELDMLARNDQLEFKRRVWEKQLDVYMATARVVGEIAAVSDRPAKLAAAADRFETLYWGNSVFLEDANVRQQMIRFRVDLHDFRQGVITVERLKVSAVTLTNVMRDSSHATWLSLNQPVTAGPGWSGRLRTGNVLGRPIAPQ